MNNEQEEYIDLLVLFVDFWRGIQKYWYGILMITVLASVAFWGYKHHSYVPMYKAQASFTVKMVGAGIEDETSTSFNFYYDKETASQIGATFPYILSSDVFLSRLQDRMGSAGINGSISAQVIENSNLVTLSVVSRNPQDALLVLEGVLDVYPDVVRYVIGNTKLEILKEAEVDETPYNSFNSLKVVIKGMALGLVFSLGLIFLYAFLKKTIRCESDLKKIFNVACLAQVPEVKNKKSLSPEAKEKDLDYMEYMYALQNRLDHLLQKEEIKVVAVTSTVPAEGKSTISVNLASAMAKRGKRVLLIDGDLRKPDIKNYFSHAKEASSIQKLLTGKTTVEKAMIQLENGVFFLGNDKPIENPCKWIQSKAMKQMIEAMKEYMDVIILDTPPCGMLADTSCYMEYADAVLYVVRQDWVNSSKIMNAVEELPDHGEKIIGCVLNRVRIGG